MNRKNLVRIAIILVLFWGIQLGVAVVRVGLSLAGNTNITDIDYADLPAGRYQTLWVESPPEDYILDDFLKNSWSLAAYCNDNSWSLVIPAAKCPTVRLRGCPQDLRIRGKHWVRVMP